MTPFLTSGAVVDLLPTAEAKGNTAQNHQTLQGSSLSVGSPAQHQDCESWHCTVWGDGVASKHLGATTAFL